jgi:hypothetical protein
MTSRDSPLSLAIKSPVEGCRTSVRASGVGREAVSGRNHGERDELDVGGVDGVVHSSSSVEECRT